MDKMLTLGIVLSAKDLLTPVLGKTNAQLSQMHERLSTIGTKMAQIGTASYGLGQAMLSPVKDTYNAYAEVAKAQGEIASLGIDDSGIKKITLASKEFSNQFAGSTAPDFIRASYDIKSGIASLSDEGVAEFTKLAALTGAATKSTTAEMTKLFALGYGIYRQGFDDDFEFGEKFSAAVSTSVKAFRTDGSDLSSGLSTLGAVATTFGVTLEEQLSILGSSKDAFNSASEAATSYRAFLQNVGKAQEALGITMTDAQGKMLPMATILDSIKTEMGDLSDVSVMDDLKKAFGSDEAVKIITALVGKTDDLRKSKTMINEEMQKGAARTEEMARAMNKGKEFEILGSQVQNLSSTIGEMFAPAALGIANIIGSVTQSISGWVEKNPTLARGIGFTVAGLGALLTVAGGILIPVGGILMALPMMSAGLTTLGVVAGAVKLGFFALTKGIIGAGLALLSSPIGLAVAGIAALAFFLYSKWEPISNFFGWLWDGVKGVFDSALNGITSMLSFSPLGLVVGAWGGMFDWFGEKFAWLGGAFEKIKGLGSSIKGFFGFGEEEGSVRDTPAKQALGGTKDGVFEKSETNTFTTLSHETIPTTQQHQSIAPASITIEINNPVLASQGQSDAMIAQIRAAVELAMKEQEAAKRERTMEDIS